MDQGQVQVIGAQFFQAVLQARNQLVPGKMADPDLAGDKQFVPRYATLGNSLADVSFVFIDLRGVDCPIAQIQGVFYRVDYYLAF